MATVQAPPSSPASLSGAQTNYLKKENSATEELRLANEKIRRSMQLEIMGKKVGDILNGIEEAQNLKVTQALQKVEATDKKITNLSTLKDQVKALQTAASLFNGAGVSYSENAGAFAEFIPFYQSGDQQALSVSVTANTAPDTIAIKVRQIATKDSVTATNPVVDAEAAMGWEGTLQINGKPITVTSNMNLKQIQSTINASQSLTGVTANITPADSGYFLSFQAQDLARPITVDTGSMTFTNGDQNQMPPTSLKDVNALSAQVEFRGTGQIKTYSSNTISDQVPGVTFTLENPQTFPADVVIGIKNNIQTPNDILFGIDGQQDANGNPVNVGFQAQWNKMVDYLKSQESYKGEAATLVSNIFGKTFRTPIAGIPDGQVNTFQGLGFSIDQEGKLQIDTDKWDTNLFTKFSELKNALGFNWRSTDAGFALMQRPPLLNDALAGNPCSVSITKDTTGTLSATMSVVDGGQTRSVTAKLGLPNGNAVSIAGPEGSIFENVKLVFSDLNQLADGDTRTTELTMTQGFMSRFAGQLEELGQPEKGFAKDLDSLSREKTTLEEKVKAVEDKKNKEMQIMIRKFQNLESAYLPLKQAQNLIKTLQMTEFSAAAA